MAENESRNERKKEEKKMGTAKKTSLSKVYYWIIGILFLILFLLVIYIFANSGDNVNLEGEEEASSLVQEVETDADDDTSADQTDETESVTEPEEEQEETEDTTEEATEEVTEEEQDETEETTEGETSVNENAPLDTGHAVDYNNGSADRVAIKQKVMEATGLGNDLIENWIGNNGPGRVTADVYSPDQSEIYRVYLQYGEGEWHVTSYESLSSIPEN